MQLPISLPLNQFLGNAHVQHSLNTAYASPGLSPAAVSSDDEDLRLLPDQATPSKTLSKKLNAASPTSTIPLSRDRMQMESERRNSITAIKAGHLSTPHRTSRPSKAARF